MYPILIVAVVVAIDQIAKGLLVKSLVNGQITVIKNFFYLTYVENYGIAFGMLKNKNSFLVVTISIISIMVAFMIYKFYNVNTSVTICLSFILGGALGNLIDRIRLGYVVDYLHFTIFPPVFNFADSAIVVGAMLLSLILVFNKDIKL